MVRARRGVAAVAFLAVAFFAGLPVAPTVAAPVPAEAATVPAPVPSHSATVTGYDLVGSDGGVFSFGSGAFYGSLPGLGIRVHDVVGMVSSSDHAGYFLVGADGGVFAFGDARFEGSLPGLGIRVHDIVGIVPTSTNAGYFLVGADGGVFAFGDASYEGSLPGSGVQVSDVVSIASTPDNQGYWVLRRQGTVVAFGTAKPYGDFIGDPVPFVAIAAAGQTGYWTVDAGGDVWNWGAPLPGFFGDLNQTPIYDIVSLVPVPTDNLGYWLIGADGGVFAFGDAAMLGSLPALGITVNDVVGAVAV